MSTNISPQNRSRSKKIEGGRVQCILYLPKDEVAKNDKVVDATDSSRSQVIAQTYFQGKTSNNK